MSKQALGSLMTLAAGLCWGISGVSGQYLMTAGLDVNLLTSLRLVISGMVLVALVLMRQPDALRGLLLDRKSLKKLGLFSLCGLVVNQYAYLKAIQHTNAGTATVLQYMAPIIILVLVCLRQRRRPTTLEVLVIGLAVLGTVILGSHGDMTQLAMTPLGLLWGIFSAFTYVAYIVLPIDLIKRWGSLPVISLGMLFGGFFFPLVTQAWQQPLPLSWSLLPAYIGIIGIGTILAYTLFIKGVSLVGPVKGSLLVSIEPVAALVFAITLLDEQFYLADLLGMAMILAAVFLISWRDLKNR